MNLADRMKLYENQETSHTFIPKLPLCIRLDGRSFTNWTKGLETPFDQRMTSLMIDVTRELVKETNALVGYTQSDEISLILYSDDIDSQIFFNGKKQKIISVLAGKASALFNYGAYALIPEKRGQLVEFDCRAWNVPTQAEACNVLLWRERDAVRNSIQMTARSMYSHTQLHGKNVDQMLKMIADQGVSWEEYPSCFKMGTYIRRKITRIAVDPNDYPEKQREQLAEQGNIITRSVYPVLEMSLDQIANPVSVIFGHLDPILKTEIL